MRWKTFLLLFVCAGLAGGTLFFYWTVAMAGRRQAAPAEAPAPEAATQSAPLVTFVDPSKGPADAPVTIVEYGDYRCPFCREAERDVHALIAAYPQRIRYVWKDFPSPLHAGSDTAAEAAFCARDQGRFWEYHDRLMESQESFDATSLSLLAGDIGLDSTDFSQCLVEGRNRPLVERSVEEALRLGLSGIPHFFVNGVSYSGQLSYDELESLVAPR